MQYHYVPIECNLEFNWVVLNAKGKNYCGLQLLKLFMQCGIARMYVFSIKTNKLEPTGLIIVLNFNG